MFEIENRKTKIFNERLLLTPREAARSLGVSEKTLYNYTRCGEIPVVRIGRAVRYSLEDLKAWIQRASEKN